MRVAIEGLMINSKPTGIGLYNINLINKLDKIIVIDAKLKIDLYTQMTAQNTLDINNINIQSGYDFKNSKNRIIQQQFGMRELYKNYDFIHFIDYMTPIYPISTPYIVTIFDLSFYKDKKYFTFGSRVIKKLISPLSIKRSKYIITISDSTKQDIIEKFNINENKIKIINPAYDNKKYNLNISSEFINQIKNKYNIIGEYILYVGTLEPRKNIERLINAYSILLKQSSEKPALVIAGGKGWMYENIFKRVKELNIKDKVIFTGYALSEEIAALYKGAKMFVYPSLYEGFGMPPLEAMACGCPVITSNCSSLPEVVGDCALKVDPHNENKIAEAMIRLLKDNDKRRYYSQKSIERSAIFSWDKSASKLFNLYDNIAKEINDEKTI
jgi:glycosyltransferase involved in cell wall biosynthesis